VIATQPRGATGAKTLPSTGLVNSLATPANSLESRLRVGALARQVVLVDAEQHTVQPNGGEGVVKHEPCRLGAVPSAARICLANQDAELSRAAALIEVH
jgi:hypothetical protein